MFETRVLAVLRKIYFKPFNLLHLQRDDAKLGTSFKRLTSVEGINWRYSPCFNVMVANRSAKKQKTNIGLNYYDFFFSFVFVFTARI